MWDVNIVCDSTGPSHTADAAAAGRQARAKRGSAPSNATAAAEAQPGAHNRANKRRRRVLVLPDSQLHEEQEQAHKRVRTGKGSGALTAGPMNGSRAGHVDPGSAEEERGAGGAAASTSEVVADSMEIGSSVADAAGDIMDDVSSADTGHHEHPAAQQVQHERPDAQQAQPDALQGQHQAQQQPGVLTTREQGRAVGAAGQLVGLGQLLSGDIQWVGPRIDPPTQMCLAPSQHQTYYKAFSRVCSMLSCLQTSSSRESATFAVRKLLLHACLLFGHECITVQLAVAHMASMFPFCYITTIPSAAIIVALLRANANAIAASCTLPHCCLQQLVLHSMYGGSLLLHVACWL